MKLFENTLKSLVPTMTDDSVKKRAELSKDVPEDIKCFAAECLNFTKKRNHKGAAAYVKTYLNGKLDQLGGQLICDKENEDIPTKTASQLKESILKGELTIEEVISQFHREKMARRDELDGIASWHFTDKEKILNKSNFKDNRLRGFVFSVKDTIITQYAPTTDGLMANLDRISTTDSDLVQKLLKAGASITTKGTVPMLLFSMETDSNIFGQARHPMNPSRTTGGSTGGCSAMCKSGFVNAVLGSDVAGSIRIPALCCGLHAFKPSPTRLPESTCQPSWDSRPRDSTWSSHPRWPSMPDSQSIIPTVIGPAGRCVEDLNTIMEVLCEPIDYEADMDRNSVQWDPLVRDVTRKMKVGLLRGIGFFPPCVSVQRTLRETVELLKAKGYEVIDLTDQLEPIIEKAFFLSYTIFMKDQRLKSVLDGTADIYEPVCKIFDVYKKYQSPVKMWLLKNILSTLGFLDERQRRVFEETGKYISFNCNELKVYQAELYEDLVSVFKATDIEGLISPGLPFPACYHYGSDALNWGVLYLFVFNLFKMPSGVLTTTTVREDEQYYEDKHNDSSTKCMKETMKNSVGLPVGISITSLNYQDEIVMRIMKDIETAMGDAGRINIYRKLNN